LVVCAAAVALLVVCAAAVALLVVCTVLFNIEWAGEADNGRDQIPMKIKYKIVE
jgi:hypothetical protein